MRRRTLLDAAVHSAFVRSRRRTAVVDTGGPRSLRLHRAALAFVVGFPGAIGTIALVAAMSRSGTSDNAFPLAIGALGLATILLALGVRSALRVAPDDVTVRFFGRKSTTVRFGDVTSATFGMAFPSLSYAITLADRHGRKALIHANWWQDEAVVMTPVCRALIKYDVPMDRATARVVSRVLGVKRPRAQIIHRALIRKDRTW